MLEDVVLADDMLDDVDGAGTVTKGEIFDEGLAAVKDEAFVPIYADALDTCAESNEEALPTKLAGLPVGTVEKVVGGAFTGVAPGDDEKAWP